MFQIEMPADFDLTLGGVGPHQHHSLPTKSVPEVVTFEPVNSDDFFHSCGQSQADLIDSKLGDLQDLLTRYETCLVNSVQNQLMASSGGVQQLLNKMTMMAAGVERTSLEYPENQGELNLLHLPDDVLLHIFSLLDAEELCKVSSVCKRCYHLSHDELLWKHKLDEDVRTWHIIGHMTNPDMYWECESDWSSKEIYLRCSPHFKQMRQREFMNFINLTSLLKLLLPRNAPKVAMFGPGLESETSSIFRRILWDKSGDFQRTAMIPGEVAGMGSGIAFRLKNKLDFHLFTLYSSTKEERQSHQALSPEQRLKKNKMFSQESLSVEGDSENPDSDFHIELNDSLKVISRKMRAFVYVVNSSLDVEEAELRWSRYELFAMVNERWTNPSIPLLVLTCTKDSTTPRRPCIDIVRHLQLGKLSRPWQAHDCVVEGLDGVADAMDWLLHRAQQS